VKVLHPKKIDRNELRIFSNKYSYKIKDETTKDPVFGKLLEYILSVWPAFIRKVPNNVKIYFKFKNEFSYCQGFVLRFDCILIIVY
jgi:hypothetical protein